MKMWFTAAMILLIPAAALLGLAAYGLSRWTEGTRALRAGLAAASGSIATRTVDLQELGDLPAPVRRYLRKVLVHGVPVVVAVRVSHTGELNPSKTRDQWRPFSSNQLVTIHPPGFDWDARIRIIPGVPVRVRDAYVQGEGILQAALFGVFPIASLRGKGEIAEGELMRFLAEAAWYPTALLPGEGVRWTEAGERCARAEFTDGHVSVGLMFHFNDEDLIYRVEAESRSRAVGKDFVPTPWGGRFWNYERRGGMLVPLQGEVFWLLPEGAKPYWRGRITSLEYRFAGSE